MHPPRKTVWKWAGVENCQKSWKTAHENSFIRQVSCGGNTINARLSYRVLNSDWLIKNKMSSSILLQIALKKDKEIYRAFWLNFLARQLGSSIPYLFIVTVYQNLRSHIFLVFIYVLMATYDSAMPETVAKKGIGLNFRPLYHQECKLQVEIEILLPFF